jgi:hypothetical protein
MNEPKKRKVFYIQEKTAIPPEVDANKEIRVALTGGLGIVLSILAGSLVKERG